MVVIRWLAPEPIRRLVELGLKARPPSIEVGLKEKGK
jgi:hypothetical protein